MFKKFKKVQIDALFEAICEEGLTPYVFVAAEHPDALLPADFVQDGMITLDLSASAVGEFGYDDEGFIYSASFGGKRQKVVVPYAAIAAMYPKENPKFGSQYPVFMPEKPKPVAYLDKKESAESGKNPHAHVGWEKTACIVH